jgi:hypothetical protein
MLSALQKLYTSDLLFVASLALSRLSVAYFLLRLTPVGRHRSVISGLLGAIAIWGLVLLFAIALTCDLSSPWIVVGQRCTGYVGLPTQRFPQTSQATRSLLSCLFVRLEPIELFVWQGLGGRLDNLLSL